MTEHLPRRPAIIELIGHAGVGKETIATKISEATGTELCHSQKYNGPAFRRHKVMFHGNNTPPPSIEALDAAATARQTDLERLARIPPKDFKGVIFTNKFRRGIPEDESRFADVVTLAEHQQVPLIVFRLHCDREIYLDRATSRRDKDKITSRDRLESLMQTELLEPKSAAEVKVINLDITKYTADQSAVAIELISRLTIENPHVDPQDITNLVVRELGKLDISQWPNFRTLNSTIGKLSEKVSPQTTTLEEVDQRIADFYKTYNPDNPKSLEEATRFFSNDQLISLIGDIIADDKKLAKIARRSYRHDNGFDKIVLSHNEDQGWKLRLHIWWPGATNLENLHDHRWNFSSHMQSGMYYNWEYYQNFDVQPDNLTPGQKKALFSLEGLERQYYNEARTAIVAELSRFCAVSPQLAQEIPTILKGLKISKTELQELIGGKEFLTSTEISLAKRIHDASQQRADAAIDMIYARIKAAKWLLIGDETATGIKGGKKQLEAEARIEELCATLGITRSDLQEYLPIYLKYSFAGNKIEDEGLSQRIQRAGIAEMEGPHISQVFTGTNRLQPRRPSHLLIVSPSLSGTTSTVILTEKPRVKTGQILRDVPLRPEQDGLLHYPEMSVESLRNTLNDYRNFLITQKIMYETFSELVNGKEKPPSTRIRSIGEEPYYLEVYFLPIIREYMNMATQGRAQEKKIYGGVLDALQKILDRHGSEFKRALEGEMARNISHHSQGHFAGTQEAYFKGEEDALQFERRIRQFAEENGLLSHFLKGSNNGIDPEVNRYLQNFIVTRGHVSRESMEMFWLLHERTKDRKNCQEWNQAFPNLVGRFLTDDKPLSVQDAEWLEERIQSDRIFHGLEVNMILYLKSKIDHKVVPDENIRNTSFWIKSELTHLDSSSDHLTNPKGRYGFLAAHSRLVSNFRELGNPSVIYL